MFCLLARIRCQDQHQGPSPRRHHIVDLVQHLQAGNRLHQQIEQDQIRVEMENLVCGVARIGDCSATTVSSLFQNLQQGLSAVFLIVDDEYLRIWIC